MAQVVSNAKDFLDKFMVRKNETGREGSSGRSRKWGARRKFDLIVNKLIRHAKKYPHLFVRSY